MRFRHRLALLIFSLGLSLAVLLSLACYFQFSLFHWLLSAGLFAGLLAFSAWLLSHHLTCVLDHLALDLRQTAEARDALLAEIEARRRAEEQIRKLTIAVEQSPASVVITDLHGYIEYVNRKFTQVTGYTLAEAVGQNPRILKSGETSPEEYRRLWQLITNGKEWRGEFHNKRKNGELYWEAASISPVISAEGQITGFIALKEDITERKRVEAELAEEQRNLEQTIKRRTDDLRESLARLEEANRAKSRFLSNISHELRTPLNAILGFSELLRGQFFGPLNDKQTGYVRQIEHGGKHLLALINDLLDLTKVDAGMMHMARQEIAPAECIEASVNMMAGQFRQKSLRLGTDIAPGLPPVYADPRKCKQVILNLLSNACKYTDAGGEVRVRAQPRGNEWVEIQVSDTGRGIEPRDQEKLFSEFYQADRVRDEQLGGTGIGLALSRRLVELQEGQIGVQSTPGQGSTFWFTLPLHHPQRAAAVAAGEPPPAGGGGGEQPRGRRILVAEDNPINLQWLQEILGLQQHQVIVARNGEEAVEQARQQRPELIFMDIRMPVMDGLEATRRLRGLPEFAQLPIVALTASAGAEDVRRQLAAGCTAHLSKPVHAEQIFEVLRRYLSPEPPL